MIKFVRDFFYPLRTQEGQGSKGRGPRKHPACAKKDTASRVPTVITNKHSTFSVEAIATLILQLKLNT